MKISIITIAYNNLEGLKSAVDCIASQGYHNIEHLVIDGESNDGTKEYLTSLDMNHVKWISEKDEGIYDALNKGLSMVTGDIVGILHSDDYFVKDDVLEKVALHFSGHDNDVLYSDLAYVRKSRNNKEKVLRYWKSGDFSQGKLKKGWMPPHPTLFMKKAVYDNIGSFDTSFRISSDYDFILRLFKMSQLRVGYLPETLVHMNVGGESNKSLKNIVTKSLEDLKIIKKNKIGGYRVLMRKNLSKIPQFIRHQ